MVTVYSEHVLFHNLEFPILFCSIVLYYFRENKSSALVFFDACCSFGIQVKILWKAICQ